jgi:predicted nucleic acid-binding protein
LLSPATTCCSSTRSISVRVPRRPLRSLSSVALSLLHHRAPVAPHSRPRPVYLDSSALVKLIAIEAETAALRRELERWPDRLSSSLAGVELARAARRLGNGAPLLVPRVLGGLRLLAVDPVLLAAAEIGGLMLRSLDAMHLATAASIADQIGALITYDHRMAVEAAALGLSVLAPD